MKTPMLASLLAMCAATAIASAQTPVPSPQTPVAPPQRTSTPIADKTVTFEGCIQRGMTAPSATPGAIGTSGAASFVLANAVMTGSNEEHAKPESPAAAAAPSAPPSSTVPGTVSARGLSYRLEADESKLSPHVGQKVEITGVLDEPAALANSTAIGSIAKLKVESVKMVAATCTAQ